MINLHDKAFLLANSKYHNFIIEKKNYCMRVLYNSVSQITTARTVEYSYCNVCTCAKTFLLRKDIR